MKSRRCVGKIIFELCMLALSGIILIPLLMLIFGSFKDAAAAARFTIDLPEEWKITYMYLLPESWGELLSTVSSILYLVYRCVRYVPCFVLLLWNEGLPALRRGYICILMWEW